MKNNVFLRGVIIAKRTFGSNHLQVKVRTKRQSFHPKDQNQFFYDYNNVNFSGNEEQIKKLFDEFQLNDHVDITGTISQTIKRRNDGKQESVQRIDGKTITLTKRILEEEFGLKSGAYLQNENRFVLEGLVSKVNVYGKNVLGINVRTFVDEKENNVSTVYFVNTDSIKDKFKVGDMVCVVGNIQSNKKTYDEEKTEYFTNFVVDGIALKEQEKTE